MYARGCKKYVNSILMDINGALHKFVYKWGVQKVLNQVVLKWSNDLDDLGYPPF
jgi:hypothetical protein